MQTDRLISFVALREIVALEDARDGEMAEQAQEVFHLKVENPIGVVRQGGFLGVEDLESLVYVGLRIYLDLLARKLRTRAVAARRIADKGCAVTDDERHLMPQVLELTQLAQRDSVSDMDIGGRRIDAQLDVQRFSPLQLFQ